MSVCPLLSKDKKRKSLFAQRSRNDHPLLSALPIDSKEEERKQELLLSRAMVKNRLRFCRLISFNFTIQQVSLVVANAVMVHFLLPPPVQPLSPAAY